MYYLLFMAKFYNVQIEEVRQLLKIEKGWSEERAQGKEIVFSYLLRKSRRTFKFAFTPESNQTLIYLAATERTRLGFQQLTLKITVDGFAPKESIGF